MTAMTIARPTTVRTSDPPAVAPGTLFGVGPSFRLTGVFSPVAPNASATSSSSTEAAAAAVSRDFEGIWDGDPVEGQSGSRPLSAFRPGRFRGWRSARCAARRDWPARLAKRGCPKGVFGSLDVWWPYMDV